jgi:hypothetical protein
MITARGRGPGLDRLSGELSAGRGQARPFPVIERDGGAGSANPWRMTQERIVCSPTVMRAELTILHVNLNARPTNPEPH